MTLDELGADAAVPSIEEQTDNLLLHLSGAARHPADTVNSSTDTLIAVLGTVDADGVRYVVDHVVAQDFVQLAGSNSGENTTAKGQYALRLSVRGWREARRLELDMKKREQPVLPLTEKQRSERLKVFMCHAKDDKRRVKELYTELTKAGAEPWFDEEVLVGGQDWELEIKKAVDSAHIFLAFLSREMVSKEGYVHKELKLGLDVALKKPEGSIYIIPILLEDCPVPESLGKYHWVDLESLAGFGKLIRSLQGRAKELGITTPIKLPE